MTYCRGESSIEHGGHDGPRLPLLRPNDHKAMY